MRLDDACSAIVDCEHKTAPITPGGKYYAVGTPAMQGNAIDYSQAREISRDTFDQWTQRLVPESGDLLFAREAPVGPIVRIPSSLNVAPGQRTVLLRPKPSVTDSSYLYYRMISPVVQRRISEVSMGSTVAHLNVADIRSLDIDIPPLPEQQAIAEVLGALDDKIAANRKLATTADALVRALYDALPDEGGKNLVDICDNVRSQVTPEGSGVAYVGLESIPRRQMWLQQFGDSSAVNSAKNEFKAGDVLFGKLRPYFHKVTSAPLPGICSTDILVLRPRNNDLAGLVLAAASSDSVISETSAASEGTRMPRTKWGILGRCQIRWPGEECATRFSQTVVTIRDAIEASARESQTLAELRDTLLPALMDGTIRVKDAEKLTEEAV